MSENCTDLASGQEIEPELDGRAAFKSSRDSLWSFIDLRLKARSVLRIIREANKFRFRSLASLIARSTTRDSWRRTIHFRHPLSEYSFGYAISGTDGHLRNLLPPSKQDTFKKEEKHTGCELL